MGRLVEGGAAPLQPVCGPLQEHLERNPGRAEQRVGLAGIAEQRLGPFGAREADLLSEADGVTTPASLIRNVNDGEVTDLGVFLITTTTTRVTNNTFPIRLAR